MPPTFSIVYPTRDRPAFVAEGLRILALQGQGSFEVIVSDNYTDPTQSCEAACRAAGLADVTYVRPPRPVGMVENWRFALEHSRGDYLLFLTDKMFVLPGALARIESALAAAGGAEIACWTSDAWDPVAFPDYLGAGTYTSFSRDAAEPWTAFDPGAELSRRGRAAVSRAEMTAPDYVRGKLLFGAYSRGLVDRIMARFGHLFWTINPDYTSMVLGLSEARGAIELARSSVVSVNTDISNGRRGDTDDTAALGFLASLEGGIAEIGPRLFVPGVYASVHNWVAHDYLSLREAHGLPFDFDPASWLTYVVEDIERADRQWSSPEVAADQRRLLAAGLEAAGPRLRAEVSDRLAQRAAARLPRRRPLGRRIAGRLRRIIAPPPPPTPAGTAFPSIHAAVSTLHVAKEVEQA